MSSHHDRNWAKFYANKSRETERLWPTEFVVRTFLARYPKLDFPRPVPPASILEVGFGDGRNTLFLCELGFRVSGVEVADSIVSGCVERLQALGQVADLRVGRNSSIPFKASEFRYLLASHACYYVDDGQSLADNLAEYARVLECGGWLIASVAARSSYIFDGAIELSDGSLLVKNDPYRNRDGYRLYGFSTTSELTEYFTPWFYNFSIGYAKNDWFGIREEVFWVVCQRR